MKRIIPCLFVLLMISFGANAQIEITPGTIQLEGDGSDTLYQEVLITNNGTEAVEIYWVYEPAANYPGNWKTQICDSRLCYLFDTFCSLPTLPNSLEPGEIDTIKLTILNKVFSFPVDGSTYAILRLYDDPDKTNEVAVSSPVTSTVDLHIDDLVIYPNPTTTTFKLTNDASVEKISIFNIVGRLERSFNHTEGMIHDVSSLREGMYLVRLENKDGNILKSLRLSKK